jgi:hypothetical protein
MQLVKKRFLYISPLKDKVYFKIGISDNIYSRLRNLSTNYNFDFSKILLYTSEKESILAVIEKELLITLPKCDHPYGNNEGFSEIREIAYLQKAIKIIRGKDTILGIKEHKYTNLFEDDLIKTRSKKKTSQDIYCNHESNAIIQRRKFLNFLKEKKELFKKYYFGRFNELVLIFQDSFPYKEVRVGCLDCILIEAITPQSEVLFHFKYRFVDDEINNTLSKSMNFMKDVCSILSIKPTKKELQIAIENEKNRIIKIENYFNKCFLSNSPIMFTDIMNKELVPIEPNLLFSNLIFLENPGQGCYWLHYKNDTPKGIFIQDNIHFQSVEERIKHLKRFYKNIVLLRNRYLLIDEENHFYLFYLMREKFNVLYSYEPNYDEAQRLTKNDYSCFLNSVYTVKDIQKKVKYANKTTLFS